jgi:adenylate kinase
MILLLLGAPGAGKGSQAVLLKDHYKIPHISTGDIFRTLLKGESELAGQVRQYLETGLLVPDELTVRVVQERLAQDDLENGFILDGFPRNLYQAERLTEFFREQKRRIDYCLNISCPEEVLIARSSGRMICSSCGKVFHKTNHPSKAGEFCDECGGALQIRKDDQIETVKARIRIYYEQTVPVIEYYKNDFPQIFLDIDGSISKEATFKQIVAAVKL